MEFSSAKMRVSPSIQDISWFLDMMNRKQVDLEPPYQRRSVWSMNDKRFFIDTILNNYPSPPVFLHKSMNDSGHPIYCVVDGKQRLKTIAEFVENKIEIPKDFNDADLQNRRWDELDKETKMRYWNYGLIVEMITDVDEQSIREIFDRINRNSRKLTPQEMRHARYDGWFITLVETEAEKVEWRKFGIFTKARYKRMADIQFISELCAIILRGKISRFDQNDIDTVYSEYDDFSELDQGEVNAVGAEIERLKSILKNMLESQKDLHKYFMYRVHFYTLWAYLHLNQKDYSNVDKLALKYLQFMNEVSKYDQDSNIDLTFPEGAIRNYATNIRGPKSTNLAPRQERLDALIEALVS